MLDAFCRDSEIDEQHDSEAPDGPSIAPSELNEPGCLVYPLVFCPPLVRGVRYVLVIRKPWGQRIALSRRTATSRHATINLARIRQEGATLGANEVHVVARDVSALTVNVRHARVT